ncbi:MAG: hypothetical protein ABMB14_40280, partial [Myxococcota bacterium]
SVSRLAEGETEGAGSRNAPGRAKAPRERPDDARAAAALGDPPLRARSHDVRLALRVVCPGLGDDAAALVVSPDGRSFARPDGHHGTIGNADAARRLLLKLAEERLARPGIAVPWDRLVEAGWPDQRIVASAARNRLKVAIAQLRKLGLRPLVLHRDDGYLLDGAVPLRLGAPAR